MKQQLIDFEKWVVDTYKEGKLRSPVHLSGGNEEELINIFDDINPNDWVFSTYRSHYHALLKGVPEDDLKRWILDNKSIHFMSDKYRVFTSAIVGGTLPIALGVAWAIKRAGQLNHVWCFIGDMTASLGMFNDCLTYARNFELPITFVIENNNLSTDTPTAEVWGLKEHDLDWGYYILAEEFKEHVKYYKYKRTYPHYGIGEFVEFKDEKLKQDGSNF